jgi:hypothetical protein
VAAILGYANWAAYTQETLMAKNPERVMKFLTELRAKLVKVSWRRGRAFGRACRFALCTLISIDNHVQNTGII